MSVRTSEWCTVKAFQAAHPELGSLNFVYDLVRRGELRPSLKVSGRVLIRVDALDQLVDQAAGARGETSMAPPQRAH